MELLGPGWLPAAILLYAIGLTVTQQLWIRPLGLVDTRWVVAGLFGAALLSLLAPSAWIAAFVLVSALSIPVSLIGLTSGPLTQIGMPSYGVVALLQLAGWVAAMGMVTVSIRGLVEPFLACLIGAAVYTNVLGFLQVHCKIGRAYRIAYGPVGEPVNEPTGCLHTVWRPACLNAMLLPVALALALDRHPAVMGCYLLAAGTMIWHLIEAKTTTAHLGAFAGLVGLGFALHHHLATLIVFPLWIVAYPSLRQELLNDPRWEIWKILWDRVKDDRFIGRGMGAWAGAGIKGTVETDRIWLWAHSEWLEALYDCGPLPLLVALGFLGDATWRAWQGVSNLQAGVYGGLLALAVVAAGYMPFRTWPLNLVGIGLLAAWLA